jgi:exopolysaccharide production protein ExoZ
LNSIGWFLVIRHTTSFPASIHAPKVLNVSDSWQNGIEALRGVAAMSVLLFHCIGLLPWDVSGTPLAIFSVGWIGVDLFFAISGYVITASAIRQKDRPDYTTYFWRARLSRILPLYYVTTAVFLLAVSSAALDKDAAFQILSHLFLAHNFFQNTAFSVNGVTWSLSVELQFYALAFFIVPLIARSGRATLIADYLALLGGVFAYRFACWYWLTKTGASDDAFIHLFSQVPALIDSFALGALICVLKLPRLTRAQTILLAFLAFSLLMAIYFIYDANAARYWASLPMTVLFRSLVALFAGVALLLTMSIRTSIAWRPMLELGKISYGIYLWHLIVLYLVQRHVPFKGTPAVLTIIVLTLLLAKLSHLAIEMPFMRWAHNAQRIPVA